MLFPTDDDSLVNAGLASSEHPKRFYKFALVDPVDKPFATFRYYYRTRAQILAMGLSEDDVIEDGEPNELSVIEPFEAEDSQNGEVGERNVTRRDFQEVSQAIHDCADDLPSSPLKTCISTGSPRLRGGGPRKHSDEHKRARPPLGLGRTSSDYRLSVPPSCKFHPPQPSRRALPVIPYKRDPAADTSYFPRAVYPIDSWERKTPSPVQSLRETISTPTLGRSIKNRLTPTGWLNAMAGAWRRRATPASDDGSRTASRNDSQGVR
jgi:hypothetical protein